jgi:hypothetical protein
MSAGVPAVNMTTLYLGARGPRELLADGEGSDEFRTTWDKR